MFTYFLGVNQYPIVELLIDFDTDNYDIFVAAGEPTTPVDVRLTIDPAVIVSSTVYSSPALSTGTGWPTGSSITITNNGQILGAGGKGGAGGAGYDCGCVVGSAGSSGGSALYLTTDISIDNTNGDVFGGGGGAGGGAGTVVGSCGGLHVWGGGGGGGTGQSGVTISGGAAGSGGSPAATIGGSGTISNGGVGGVCAGNVTGYGGNGGTGGAWGTAGTAGGTSTGTGCASAGGAGGAAGKAAELNSNSINWLGGNNPTQVKGAVS